MITKKAVDPDLFKRVFYKTESAREAWKEIILTARANNPSLRIILPGYIGWSVNEGSGIFDAVNETGTPYEFYSLNYRLEIDFEDIKKTTIRNPGCLVLLVHYFGFADKSYETIISWLKGMNILFVEDCAHAWLSDLMGGMCGRAGRFSFYSLHKLLPMKTGGILVDNFPAGGVDLFKFKKIDCFFSLDYDLLSIFRIRRENYRFLKDLLKEIKNIEILHSYLPDGICPQTFPVITKGFNRDRCYHDMNDSGFGTVSLYHTMIKELENYDCEATFITSKQIMNFPIHQDASKEEIAEMVRVFKNVSYGI